jgi:hypothetical protein
LPVHRPGVSGPGQRDPACQREQRVQGQRVQRGGHSAGGPGLQVLGPAPRAAVAILWQDLQDARRGPGIVRQHCAVSGVRGVSHVLQAAQPEWLRPQVHACSVRGGPGGALLRRVRRGHGHQRGRDRGVPVLPHCRPARGAQSGSAGGPVRQRLYDRQPLHGVPAGEPPAHPLGTRAAVRGVRWRARHLGHGQLRDVWRAVGPAAPGSACPFFLCVADH